MKQLQSVGQEIILRTQPRLPSKSTLAARGYGRPLEGSFVYENITGNFEICGLLPSVAYPGGWAYLSYNDPNQSAKLLQLQGVPNPPLGYATKGIYFNYCFRDSFTFNRFTP
jgi:hypothetical protein